MASGAWTAVAYEFGPFHVDFARHVLLRDGKVIAASPTVFNLLLVFLRSGNRVLSKEELMRAVWPDTFVDDGSILRTVSRLRKVLRGGSYIETVSRRGYRFAAAVRPLMTHSCWAVLPFSVLTRAAAETADMGVGIADVLITKLIRMRAVTLRPTSSVLRYVDSAADVATIGRELRVSAVLEGHLQLSSTQVRTTVQLIDVDELQPFWADIFTIPRSDCFVLQDAIAERIAKALSAYVSTNVTGVALPR